LREYFSAWDPIDTSHGHHGSEFVFFFLLL
jgi:hypothetical protein